MKLYQRGRDENKTWTPETWRSASMYDKVYQNHLAMEAHLQSEGEDKDSSDHDAGGALASKGPELIDVASSGEEEIHALEAYEADQHRAGQPRNIEKASNAWKCIRGQQKADRDLSVAVKLEKSGEA